MKFIILRQIDNSSIKTNSVEKTVIHEIKKFNNLLKKLKVNILFESDYKQKNFLILLKKLNNHRNSNH